MSDEKSDPQAASSSSEDALPDPGELPTVVDIKTADPGELGTVREFAARDAETFEKRDGK